MDDAFVIQQKEPKENFLHYINNIDSAIKFTVEDTRPDGSVPFLDTLVIPEHNGTCSTRVYRRPSHMDQYLQWDNHHYIGAKYYIINTLNHRSKIVPSTAEYLRTEVEHIKKVLPIASILQGQ